MSFESNPFNQGPDLNNPKCLAGEMEVVAGGLNQQCEAAKSNSALGGHPAPAELYRRAAMLLTYAAELIRKHVPAVAVEPKTVDAPAAPPVTPTLTDGAKRRPA